MSFPSCASHPTLSGNPPFKMKTIGKDFSLLVAGANGKPGIPALLVRPSLFISLFARRHKRPPYSSGLPYSFPYWPSRRIRPIRSRGGGTSVVVASLHCTRALAPSLPCPAFPPIGAVCGMASGDQGRKPGRVTFGQEDPLLGQSSAATPLGVRSLLRP